MTDVRIAVVGYGNMGRYHVASLADGKIPGAKLGAIVDNNPTVLEQAKVAYPDAAVFASTEEMVAAKAADAVLIATPHYFHPPLAILSLNAGLHALVEKPAGAYTKQVREMNEVASKSDKVFGIMFNQRTNGAHQKMRDIVASGELGEIKRVLYVITDWTRTQSYYDSGGWRATWEGEGGGVLLNQSPHNLDLLQWITGMPKRVRGFCSFGKYHNIEVEDDVTAYLEYDNGATGVFITTTGEAPGTKLFEVVGDRGKLVLENNKVTFHRTVESVSKFIAEFPGGFGQPETWICDVPASGGEEHIGILKGFVKAITEGAPLLASGLEGINGTTLANAMLLSSWTDSWVNLPLDDDLYFEKLQEQIKNSTVKKDASEQKVLNVDGTF
ncbi:MAG TPA: Gfo/Idh/MocA family oxidoreductase [Capsulimonadaceae bacterium]|jgi:predicted dehydrogenase